MDWFSELYLRDFGSVVDGVHFYPQALISSAYFIDYKH